MSAIVGSIIPNRIQCLDHGFVHLRNISGPTRRHWLEFDATDVDPPNAARMSFNQTDSGRTFEQDMKLSEYLIKNWHNTPFEMIEIWTEMKLPIFLARQLVRHRTAGINEVSGRYVTLPAEWYIPEVVGGKAANKKQGQEDNLSPLAQEQFKVALDRHCHRGYVAYTNAIDDGVAPEHARMFLSLNHYTHWLFKLDLHNMFNLLRLRDHSHAQKEANVYAQALTVLLEGVLPATMALYRQYRKEHA